MKLTRLLMLVALMSAHPMHSFAADFNGTMSFANIDSSPATEIIYPAQVVGFTQKLEDVEPLTQAEKDDFTETVASQLRYYTNSNIPFTYSAVLGSTTVTVLEPQLLGVAELQVSYSSSCNLKGLFDTSGLLTDPVLTPVLIPFPLTPFLCPATPVSLPQKDAADIFFLDNSSGAGSTRPGSVQFPTDTNAAQYHTMKDAAYQQALISLGYDGENGNVDATEICSGVCMDSAKPDCAIKSVTFDDDANSDGHIAIDVTTPWLGTSPVSFLDIVNTKKESETNTFTPIVECHCIKLFQD